MKAYLTQTSTELRLALRQGEQLLVSLGIPLMLLVFFSVVDVLPIEGDDPVQFLAPGVLALAVMSTALVSLGISTGFERQYRVLKRLGTNPEDAAHLAHTGSPWPENPDCIYMGGFGIGPMNPVSSFDQELGLWVRSIAIGDGEDTTVLTVVDGEGWLWDYASKCDDCGAKQLGESLGAAGAGQEPHRGLRQAQLGLLLGDADVAGQRHLQPAPHGVAVDGGDADPMETGQGLEGAAERLGHLAGVLQVAVGEHLEIGAGAEELLPGAADHQGHHVGAAVELHHHLQEGLQAGEGPGVGGRVIEGDVGHVTVVFEPDPCHCIVLVMETCP